MNSKPDVGPHHSRETNGGNSILVEFVGEFLPHDSPEFIERAKKGRPPGSPPIPDYLRRGPKPDFDNPPQ